MGRRAHKTRQAQRLWVGRVEGGGNQEKRRGRREGFRKERSSIPLNNRQFAITPMRADAFSCSAGGGLATIKRPHGTDLHLSHWHRSSLTFASCAFDPPVLSRQLIVPSLPSLWSSLYPLPRHCARASHALARLRPYPFPFLRFSPPSAVISHVAILFSLAPRVPCSAPGSLCRPLFPT